jgi:hypothetical protein
VAIVIADRRNVLRLALIAPLVFGGARPDTRSSRPLRVGIVVAAGHDELARGIEFGLDEARYSAKLLGRQIVVVDLSREPAEQVDVIVLASPAPYRTPDHSPKSGVAVIRLLPVDVADPSSDRSTTDGHSPPRARDPNELLLFPGGHVVASVAARLPAPAAGVERRIVVWDASLERFGAGQLNDRYRSRFGAGMSPEAWLGWFAVKLVWDAASRVRDTTPDALLRYIIDPMHPYDGHKGAALRFNDAGELVQPLYVLERGAGTTGWALAAEVRP